MMASMAKEQILALPVSFVAPISSSANSCETGAAKSAHSRDHKCTNNREKAKAIFGVESQI